MGERIVMRDEEGNEPTDALVRPCITMRNETGSGIDFKPIGNGFVLESPYGDEATSSDLLAFDFKPVERREFTIVDAEGLKCVAKPGRYYVQPHEGLEDTDGLMSCDLKTFSSYRIWGMEFVSFNALLIVSNPELFTSTTGEGLKYWRVCDPSEGDKWAISIERDGEGSIPASFVTLEHLISGVEWQALDIMIEAPEIAKTGERKIQTVTGALGKMPTIHDFSIRALKGLEEIAYSNEGRFVLWAKNGTRQNVVLKANPHSCSQFIANKNANWQYASRITAIVCECIRANKGIAYETGGRVWITTNTIARELTRTEEGVNSGATRNASFTSMINDCLEALSSAQIQMTDAGGNLCFMGYLFNAVYVSEAVDNCGNRIKDVWGFSIDAKDLSFAMFSERGTTKRKYLAAPPMNPKNAWIVQVFQGDILSEIRNKLYPKRGKGLKEYTATRQWEDIFKAANVKADGNISSHARKSLVEECQDKLIACAKNERDNPQPIYIEAKSIRDASRGRGKGAWESLVVTGHKNLKKSYEIDLLGD